MALSPTDPEMALQPRWKVSGGMGWGACRMFLRGVLCVEGWVELEIHWKD